MEDDYDKNILYSSLPERLKPIQDEIETKDVVCMLNMQKTFYDIKLEDIESKIDRLEIRNEEISKDLETREYEYENTDIETVNRVADLNRKINTEMNKIEDYVNKLNAVEKWTVEEDVNHSNKVNDLEERYNNTKIDLTSQMKVLTTKINILEEYKIDKDFLEDKLKSRDNTLNVNEENVERAIKDIDLRFKIDTDKLKSEMYVRLFGLARTFQIDVARRKHTPIHRLIRDNITLNKNLTLIRKRDDAKHYKTNVKKNRSIVRRHNDKIKRYLIVNKIQDSLIKLLKEIQMKHDVVAKEIPNNLDRFTKEINYNDFHIKTIQGFLYREQVELNSAKVALIKLKCKLKECFDTLYNLKYTVSKGLQTADDDDSTIFQLGEHLLNIIKKGQLRMKNVIVGSCESIPRPETVYLVGDLGFEPEHVNIDETISSIDPIDVFFIEERRKYDSREEHDEFQIEDYEELGEDVEDDI